MGWAKIVHMLKFCFSYVCWQKNDANEGFDKGQRSPLFPSPQKESVRERKWTT